MHSLLDVWLFTRERLKPAYKDLTEQQLLWRPHADAHNIGELLYHIAGAEHYYACRISERNPRSSEWEEKLDRAVTDGFLRELSVPVADEDMKMDLIEQALEFTALEIRPILETPTEKEMQQEYISPIGDHLNGYQGLIRLVQHAGYHTGQIWVYRMDPRFPKT
jgi:uncharacterized damage-inducible protein DinB